MLALAGVAGIVVGLAAQSTLGNFIAGTALAFSQPIRLNDAVIYQRNFGTVEEITLLHTVIRTWDNRRIVVPNSTINNDVIQNWTMKDTWLLGAVMLYVDYTCDIEKVKKWTQEIVNNSEFSTEERLAGVQVTDFTDKVMVLRIVCKSWDAPNTWNLRCEIREKLIAKFQQEGVALPQIRVSETKRI